MIAIVGPGRVGGALAAWAQAAGVDHHIFGRDDDLTVLNEGAGPIVVCTRNDDVANVLDRCPRAADMVYVQNGALLPWLRARGAWPATHGVLYFAVATRGEAAAPGGASLFFGPHAHAIVYLLQRAGIPSRVLPDEQALLDAIATKLLWAAIFGLLGDLNRETVLASVARRGEVAQLVQELVPVCDRGLGSRLDADAVLEALLSYSRQVGSWRASVKEWPWRNGWIEATARAHALPTPGHDARVEGWRRAAGVY